MSERPGDLLVLGIGNVLMGDEGVGVHFIHHLEKDNHQLPADVDLLDGGTSGLLLMQYLEEYPYVILIDATLDHNPPGTIRLTEPKFAKDFPTAMSTHEIGLKDLIENLCLLDKMPRISLFLVSVANISNLHVGLSKRVENTIPLLHDLVVRKVNEIERIFEVVNH